MGITFLKVKMANPARPRAMKELKFLVDSGALYSVVPARDLKALGIGATSTEEFMLANGETISMRVGNALFEYGGKTRAAPVVFGEPGVLLLGVTTLEALGMTLDPIHRELRPLPMLLMPSAPRTSTISMRGRRVKKKRSKK